MDYYNYLLTVKEFVKEHHPQNVLNIENFVEKYKLMPPELKNETIQKNETIPKLKLMKPVIKIKESSKFEETKVEIFTIIVPEDTPKSIPTKKSIKFNKCSINKNPSEKE